MQLERDENGDYLLDPSLLTAKLSIDADQLRHRMRLGLVTSIVETGIGEDAGRQRLTVRCGNVVWRIVIDGRQNVVGKERFDLA